MTMKEWSNSHEQLDDLLRLLKRHGVSKYVGDGVEIHIFPKLLEESFNDVQPSAFGKQTQHEDDYHEINRREKLLADIQGEF